MSVTHFRHVVPFVIAITAAVTAVQYFAYIGFKKCGLTGPMKVIHPE